MRLGRLAFAGVLLSVGTAWAATGDALIVTGDGVNVRFGPSTDAGVKMQVYRNQQVIELERQGDWVRAEIAGTSGEEGWIHGSLLEGRPEGAAPAPAPAAAAEAEPSPPAEAAAQRAEAEPEPAAAPAQAPTPEPGPAQTAEPATAVAAAAPSAPEPSAMPEPAAGPDLDLPELEQFRESVDYLNSRAQAVAGVDLFTGVKAASEDVVQVSATDAWGTIPPAGQRSYLNTLVDRWAAAKGGGMASVQIVDPSGDVVMEHSGP